MKLFKIEDPKLRFLAGLATLMLILVGLAATVYGLGRLTVFFYPAWCYPVGECDLTDVFLAGLVVLGPLMIVSVAAGILGDALYR